MNYKKRSNKECYLIKDSITFKMKTEYCLGKATYQLNYTPDLASPKTLNEKIIWLALNYKNPDIKIASDKYTAKGWISERVGAEYVAPLIGVYEDIDGIPWDSLPESFVVKSTCGWAAKTVKVVRHKADVLTADSGSGASRPNPEFEAEFTEWLRPWSSYYYANMCVGDEDIVPRIVAEELLGHDDGFITDYKIFFMNGEPKFIYVVDDRNEAAQTKTFLDLDWNVLPCHRYDIPAAKAVDRPDGLNEMLRIGSVLSKDFPLVRVDFYYVDGRVYVGEMTFTPGMFLSIEPWEWDEKLGEMLELPR